MTNRTLWIVSMVFLDIGKEEEVKMILDRLTGGKELLVDLLVF